jgi:DNA-3-methyladenine glycosylase I
MKKNLSRCRWASDPLNALYHDREWGRPVHDDRVHFEFLILEGAQAGLSWLTILKRRDNYRKAFSNFDYRKIVKYTAKDVQRLMKDEGIIRNRLKIESVISNAEAFIEVQNEFGSFDAYVWSFVKGIPVKRKTKSIRATSRESDRLSKDLKARGFRFVGSTICYAYMQACGLVDDHDPECFLSGGIIS